MDETDRAIEDLIYKYLHDNGAYLGITGPLFLSSSISKAIKDGKVPGVTYNAPSIKVEGPDPTEIDAAAEERRTNHHA